MAGLIGQRLGQYEIAAKLGAGGMATVYRARQASIGRDVAVKVIESKLADNPEFIKRFEREARTIAALNHPHILKLFDFGQHEESLYLVMELQPGGSLADLVKGNPLPLEQTSRLLEQIASALDYAHGRGIIHRDLKPQNVLLDEQGNAILTDFGIAKLMHESTALTAAGSAMGTPSHMAPEQWQGERIDARSDIYSLGIMVFEMLSGHLPFSADTPYQMMHAHIYEPPSPIRTWRPDLPASVETLLRRALAKDPDQRFQTAGELAIAFQQALSSGELRTAARQDTALPPAVTPASPVRRRYAGILAVGVVIVVAAAAALVLFASRNGQNIPPDRTLTTSVLPAAALSDVTSEGTTPAPTATVSATPSATATPTSTFTATPPPTATQTATPSPIPSPSATASPTPTPAATDTPQLETLIAATYAHRATLTAIVEASFTSTPTPDLLRTLEAAVAASDTAVAVASFTRTPTPDVRQTLEAGVAATLTAITKTPTPSPTVTPSATVTPTPIPTHTPTPQNVPTLAAGIPSEPVAGATRIDGRGTEQVWVPAGCFQMGSDPAIDTYSKPVERPQREVCLTNGFWLDKYEVTNAAFQEFINDSGYNTPEYWSAEGWKWRQSKDRRAPDDYSGFTEPQQPRVGITWYEAEAYANWRGGRLPTEAEWEYAARGQQPTTYPWGNLWDSSRVNADNLVGRTVLVGSYEGGKSWVGAYDMLGNAWEWVLDWYDADFYKKGTRLDPVNHVIMREQRRVLRGGGWNFGPDLTRTTARVRDEPYVSYPNLGVRVVTPGSVGSSAAIAPSIIASLATSVTTQASLRAGPGTEYPEITSIYRDDEFVVLSYREGWLYVRFEDSQGWIEARFTNYTGDVRSLPSPEALGIAICALPVDAFRQPWAAALRDIGCSKGAPLYVLGTSQPYENGIMIWRSDRREIYVITSEGQWSTYIENYRPGEKLTCAGQFIAHGFGQVYCNNPNVQRALGSAVAPERPGSTVLLQEFDYGLIVKIDAVGIRVLAQKNFSLFGSIAAPETTIATPIPASLPLLVAPPASLSDFRRYRSIWFNLQFRDRTTPGVETYTTTVDPGSPLGFSFNWCADSPDRLREILIPLTVSFAINDTPLDPSHLSIFSSSASQTCRHWATILSGWDAGSSVILEVRYRLSASIFDGSNTYAAGEYMHRIHVTIQPVSTFTPEPRVAHVTVTCPGSPPTRLQIGQQGRVLPGEPNSLNTKPSRPSRDPTSKRLTLIPGNGVFTVLEGPVCANGYAWWQVDYRGIVGWTPEGEGSTYWLEPIAVGFCPGAPSSQVAVGMRGRVAFTDGSPTNLRSEPAADSKLLRQMPEGYTFTIIDGPVCGRNRFDRPVLWWKLRLDNGLEGWAVEQSDGVYAIEPAR